MPVGPFFADFLCRELALVVECDGFSHDVAPERDAGRDAWMAAHGYTVLRFTNAEVQGNVEGVVSAIRQEVERLRALQPSRLREGREEAKLSKGHLLSRRRS